MQKQTTKPRYVIGCIDHTGDIRAIPVDIDEYSNPNHTPELSKGRKWRWIIELKHFTFSSVPSDLTEEEQFLVIDWLTQHGYN